MPPELEEAPEPPFSSRRLPGRTATSAAATSSIASMTLVTSIGAIG